MAVPLDGQCANAHETPGCQLDRLTASQDGFDNVGGQEGDLDTAPDIARIDAVAARDLLDGRGFSSRQCIEPEMGPSKQGDEIFVGRRGCALRGIYNHLRLDPATFQLEGDREVDQSFRKGSAAGVFLGDQAGEGRSLELDMDRAGAKRDAVKEAVQQLAVPQLAVPLRLFISQIGCG